MAKNKPAKTELAALALDLLEDSRRGDLFDSEEEMQELWDSRNRKIRPRAVANREIRNKPAEMAWRHFISLNP